MFVLSEFYFCKRFNMFVALLVGGNKESYPIRL